MYAYFEPSGASAQIFCRPYRLFLDKIRNKIRDSKPIFENSGPSLGFWGKEIREYGGIGKGSR